MMKINISNLFGPRQALAAAMTFAVASALASCAAEQSAAEDNPADDPRARQTAPAVMPIDDQPVDDQPVEHVPPATTPAAGPEGTNHSASGDASFSGYGDIAFGTVEADMEKAWSGELKVLGKESNDRCYFMTPVWVKTPAEFNFMMSEGKFARFGTESEKFAAPGGGKVGMRKQQIAQLYTGRIEEQPHKYSDGLYLRVADDAGGKGVLIFETDGKSNDAKVIEWRVGMPPEVDYVEGCS